MSHRPPPASLSASQLARLAVASSRLTPTSAWAISLGALVVINLVNIASAQAMSFLFPNIVVFCFAAWCLRERGGLVIGLLSVAASTVIAHIEATGALLAPMAAAELWNGLGRLLTMVLMVAVVSGLRYALELERWRASTDGLTGVLNKSAFELRMVDAIEQARERGHALLLANMDLDGFKSVNDRHGHAAGDEVLRAFAHAAADSIRGGDLFARTGGDEFVALLTVPNPARGEQAAEMLHARLTRILEQTGFNVTCSMGALVIDAPRLEISGRMVALADRLMYEVKRSGKDALRVARGDGVGAALRCAFPPEEQGDFEMLLQRMAGDGAPIERRVAA